MDKSIHNSELEIRWSEDRYLRPEILPYGYDTCNRDWLLELARSTFWTTFPFWIFLFPSLDYCDLDLNLSFFVFYFLYCWISRWAFVWVRPFLYIFINKMGLSPAFNWKKLHFWVIVLQILIYLYNIAYCIQIRLKACIKCYSWYSHISHIQYIQ